MNGRRGSKGKGRKRETEIPGWGDDSSDLRTGLLQAEVVGPGGQAASSSGARGRKAAAASGSYAQLNTYDDDDDDDDDGYLQGVVSSQGESSGEGRARKLSNSSISMVNVNRSTAERERIKNQALAKQQANAEKFMQQLKQEEDAFLARIKKKKQQEDEDSALARQLQEAEELAAAAEMRQHAAPQAAAQQGVPPNTQLVRISLPENSKAGDVLRINVPGVGLRDVIVPPGVAPGLAVEFRVPKSVSKIVRIVIPPNTVPGSMLTIRVPGSDETVQVQVPPNGSPGSTLQFTVKSQRLPPPANAVGHDQHLRSLNAVYGGAASMQPAAPRRQAAQSSGLTSMSPEEREAFLAAMPPDVREELLQLEREELQEMQMEANAGVGQNQAEINAERMAFYAALPPEIREQVMAEEARQERALQQVQGRDSGASAQSSGGGGGGSGGGGLRRHDGEAGDSKEAESPTPSPQQSQPAEEPLLDFNSSNIQQTPTAAVSGSSSTADELGGLFDGLQMNPALAGSAGSMGRVSQSPNQGNLANGTPGPTADGFPISNMPPAAPQHSTPASAGVAPLNPFAGSALPPTTQQPTSAPPAYHTIAKNAAQASNPSNLANVNPFNAVVAGIPPAAAASTPVAAASTPVAASSTPVAVASTLVAAASTSVAAASTPVAAASTPVVAASTPVAVASTPVAAASTPVAAASTPMVAGSFLPSTASTAPAPSVTPSASLAPPTPNGAMVSSSTLQGRSQAAAPADSVSQTGTGSTGSPAPPLERLRKARMLLAEGLIDQNEFNEVKQAVLAELKSK